MIAFSEIRKLSLQWQTELADVERAYATDWLMYGIFHSPLAEQLIARGAAALHHAYFSDYPAAETLDFFSPAGLNENNLRAGIDAAVQIAADASDLKFARAHLDRGGAKVEYTGPLGRRSAAQPRVTLAIIPGLTRLPPARAPLLHLFSDPCAVTITAIALEEFAANQIAMLAQSPRARDVFDVWFVLTRARERINLNQTRDLANQIAREKIFAPVRADALFAPEHRARLARGWEIALKNVRAHPSFEKMETDLTRALATIYA